MALMLDWNSLSMPIPPWAHLVACSYREIDVATVLHRESVLFKEDMVIRILRGSYCRTGLATLDHWAAALQFPYYFGRNLNAFDECIKDLGWLSAGNYLFIVTAADELLCEESTQAFSSFLSILQEAAELWAEPSPLEQSPPEIRAKYARGSVPFHVLFQATPENKRETVNRYLQAGCILNEIY